MAVFIMSKPVLLIVFIVTGLFSLNAVFAQTAAQSSSSAAVGASLEAEIQNIERTIARQGISAPERHEALVRLARLRQLSGDIEGAARNWLEAATAIPGRVDDEALLACAYCLAAMGEWDRAATALEPLLTKSLRARFLDLSIKAIRTGDTSALALLADNPLYAEMKPEIIFTLWKVTRGSSADRWRQRLITEFPQTLEGRLAAGESPSLIVRPSPFWLFAGGLDSLPLISNPVSRPAQVTVTTNAAQTPQQSSVQASAVQATPSTPQQTSQATQQTTSQTTPQTTGQVTQQTTQQISQAPASARLQTGIFSRQENAQAQITALRNAGFSPSLERRLVNNNEMWAVTVPVGADQTRTMNALRTAGFESFLVR